MPVSIHLNLNRLTFSEVPLSLSGAWVSRQTERWEEMASKVPSVSDLVSPRFPRPKLLSPLGCVN